MNDHALPYRIRVTPISRFGHSFFTLPGRLPEVE
jgi:hypothetical protein